MVYENGDPKQRVPIALTMYLIRSGERLILADAGCYTMPGFHVRYFCGPRAVLRSIGVSSEAITDVVITHAHHDHIEAVGEYTNATVYIQRRELSDGRRYIPDTMSVVTFGEVCDLGGGVTIRCISGHSVGSSIVTVDTRAGEYVIVGDECYARDCLTDQRPIGSVHDRERSNAFLREYQHANTLLCHENILPGKNGAQTVI